MKGVKSKNKKSALHLNPQISSEVSLIYHYLDVHRFRGDKVEFLSSSEYEGYKSERRKVGLVSRVL